MDKKSILVLFILSFVSVIFTLNNICYRHIDDHIDNYFVKQKYGAIQAPISVFLLKDPPAKVLSENKRLVITLTVAVLFLVVYVFSSKITSILFTIFFLIAYFTAYKLLLDQHFFLNTVGILCAIVLAKCFSNLYIKTFKDDLSKKIESVLSKYISNDIKDKILKNTDDIGLGGKRAEITVMFADIRGFTSLSETRKAEEVSQLLNEYFSELEPIIAKYNGVINKFIGDAVLVVFGDPEQDKYHAKNAVKCAYELRKKVKQIRERWIQEGKPKIDIGVGINTGDAFIGNVGTKNRFEYTVIGDAVNIASRIEDYNKIYKTQILISENTYNKISQLVDVIKIREVAIKGKRHKINIYEVLRITE